MAWKEDRERSFYFQELRHPNNSNRPRYDHMYRLLAAEVQVAFDNSRLQQSNKMSTDDIHLGSGTNRRFHARNDLYNLETGWYEYGHLE